MREELLLQRRISGNGDSSSPASWGEARTPDDASQRKRLEENDKKSGKSRRVWKSLWGSYAAGTGTFLMCGHHFVQHKEDVGAHLLSVLHSGFPQKVSVNVKNVFLLWKGLCHEGSFRTIIWLKIFFFARILGKIWHLYLFTQAMLLWCYFWNYRFCAKPDIALLLCVCQKHIISTFFFFNFFWLYWL